MSECRLEKKSGPPLRLGVLVFLKNVVGEFLMLKRIKEPHKGCWTSIGGKLEVDQGESPHECAVRETKEEVGMDITKEDLRLFSIVTEKNYNNDGNWLMFLFDCRKAVEKLPASINEGHFKFFPREAIDALVLPQTDVWPVYDKYHEGFVVLKADCTPEKNMHIVVEEAHASLQSGCSLNV